MKDPKKRYEHEQSVMYHATRGVLPTQLLEYFQNHSVTKTYMFTPQFMQRYRNHPAFEDALFGAVKISEELLSGNEPKG